MNMSARHILFVETEGDSLQTLMRGLAGSHDDWHIVRIAEQDAALEMLSQRVFCVVMQALAKGTQIANTFCRKFRAAPRQ